MLGIFLQKTFQLKSMILHGYKQQVYKCYMSDNLWLPSVCCLSTGEEKKKQRLWPFIFTQNRRPG